MRTITSTLGEEATLKENKEHCLLLTVEYHWHAKERPNSLFGGYTDYRSTAICADLGGGPSKLEIRAPL
jgi:hypothetical protein